MTFNIWTFLFEVLNFLVLAFVLHRLLYHPLREAVERRRREVAREQEEAEKARQDAATLESRLKQQLADQEQERLKLLREAHEQAEADRKKLLAETERVIRDRQEEQRRALEREREEALQSLRGEVADWAVGLTRRLLAEAADSSLHRQLALRLVETLRHTPEGECEHLRDQWQPGDGAVLETSQALDDATLGQITDGAEAVLGRPVVPAVQVRPELVCGVRLRLGGQVWDASLAGQLDEGPVPAVKESSCPNGRAG
jgi:F-type H+-transporting ATPase subunit b